MYMRTESSSSTNTAIVLPMMISDDRGVEAVLEERVRHREERDSPGRLHPQLGDRRSRCRSGRSGRPAPRCANGMNAVPGAVAASASTGTVMVPRALVTRTSSPSALTPMRSRSLGWTTSANPVASAAERRARRHDASGVVQRAGGHEAETVRVRRRRGRRCRRAVPAVQRRAAPRAPRPRTPPPHPTPPRPRRRPRTSPGLIVVSEPVPLDSTTPVPSDERCDSSAATPGLIGSHDRPVVTPSTCWKVISSGKSAIGRTAPSRARRMSSASTPACAGRDAGDLVLHVLDGVEPEVGAEARRELLRDPPVVHRGALGRDEPRLAHHPSLEVGGGAGLLAPHRGREEHVGAGRGVGGERAHRDRELHRVEPGAHADAVGEVLLEVGTEQHQGVDRAGGGGLEHAGGVEAGLRGTLAPRVGVVLAAGVERDPARQETGGEPEVERAAHVAAPERATGT